MEKSEKIVLLSTIILIGFVLSVIFHYILGFYLQQPYPFNTFLWSPNIVLSDFIYTMDLIKDFAPFQQVESWINYFPLSYIILFPFTLIKSQLLSFLFFSGFFLIFFVYINFKYLWCKNFNLIFNFKNFFIITFLSYPFLIIMDRGNFDMFLFVFMSIFIFIFYKKRFLLSAFLLGIINAFKPFFIIFLALFLFKKKWKEFFISLLLSFILIFVGFLILKGDFLYQINILITNLKIFKYEYVYSIDNNLGMFAGSSFYMALKLLLLKLYPFLISKDIFIKIYEILSILSLFIIMFFSWKEHIFWKKISLLFLYVLSFPYLVNDYKLLFLFIPLWFFINSKEKNHFDLIYTILFALLFIPKNIIIPLNLTDYFSLSIIINPIIIGLFIGLIIFEQIKNKSEEKRG